MRRGVSTSSPLLPARDEDSSGSSGKRWKEGSLAIDLTAIRVAIVAGRIRSVAEKSARAPIYIHRGLGRIGSNEKAGRKPRAIYEQ